MLTIKVIWLAFAAVVFVNGCHHNKEDVPPDTFPEEGGEVPSRKKRSITIQSDVDKEVSDFFTICMFEKTGSVYNSWRSVVDFVLRDTRWYSASDFQYCKENADFDPKAVSCWQNRLKNLLKVDSKLLSKAQECVEEFQWDYEDLPIRRGKRSISYSSAGFDTCLGVSLLQYGKCVSDQLLTKQNLRKYPSLKDYDSTSVDEFVKNEFTDCRIQSRSTFYGNIYTETCPTKYLPFFTKPKETCLSSIFREVVRTSSPLYTATKTCINKYSADKCKYVNCFGSHQQCDKNTGLCVCKDGYQQNFKGECELRDKCNRVYCNRPNEICDPNTGNCVCQTGYEKDSRGICAMDRCSRVYCNRPNEICDPNTGRCVCKSGYQKDARGLCTMDKCNSVVCTGRYEICDPNTGRCICRAGYSRDIYWICKKTNPCATVRCQTNMECTVDPVSGAAKCVCKSGYVDDPNRPGCMRKDPCYGISCPVNSRCVRGDCICDSGYEKNHLNQCVKKDPCASKNCGPNARCRVNPSTGQAFCYCPSGYVENFNGYGCKKRDPCDGINCPPNSDCVQGACVCRSGYKKDRKNMCVAKDPCSTKTCGTNKRCIVLQSPNVGICVCKSGYVLDDGECKKKDPCDGVKCPPNSDCVQGTCVCRSGYKKNSRGVCVKTDPCSTKKCDKNMECKVIQSRGICLCLPGYVPDPDMKGCKKKGCEPRNCGIVPLCFRPNCPAHPDAKCKTSNCDCREWYEDADGNVVDCTDTDMCEDFCDEPAEECFVENGYPNCRCADGFSLDRFGICVGTDPCRNLQCDSNMLCDAGSCVCIPGFIPNPNGRGCIKKVVDPCAGKNCPPFSDCVGGDCICHSGHKKQRGICIKINACETMRCGRNMLCDAGSCVCIPGFVPSPDRPECIRKVTDPCAGKTCPQLSNCVAGDCVCRSGYHMRNNVCISTDPCISGALRCGPNMDCNQGKCSCKPGFTPAPQGRPGCVRSSTGVWDEWGKWGECSRPCGGGSQFRLRTCKGTNCVGGRTESRECNMHQCGGGGGCPSSKVPNRCPTKCPKHCDNRGIELSCAAGCREGVSCVCKEGMIERNAKNTTCILPEHCPGLCWPNPCKHGGKCYPVGAYHICQCKTGYAGKNCELGCGEYCQPNGQCTRGTCVCNRGYVPDGEGGCKRG